MKAAEVLRLYEEGWRDFRGQNLRGQNFKGKDLSGADFSGADIRSANFTSANLTGVKFTQAKAGLQQHWAVGLVVASLLLSVVSGFLSALAGAFASTIFDFGNFEIQSIGLEALAVIVVFLFFLFYKGIEAVAGALAGAAALAGAIALAKAIAQIFVGIFAVAIAGSAAGAIGVAVAFAVTFAGAIAVAGAEAGTLTFAVAIVGAIVGALAGAGVIVDAEAKAIVTAVDRSITIAVAVSVAGVMTLESAYIGWRALKGDKRDAWMRSVAIAFAAIGGTSFRGATLIDANFSQACLKSTDFRRSVLLRTCWRDAEKLDRVRPGETYLNIPKIRELVCTGNGQGQSYGHLLNLVGLNLQGANLVQADFTGSTLKTGTLQGATLAKTYFTGADLNRVNLQGADLSNAKLVQTQLDQADLTGATLTGACIEDWNVNSSTKLVDITCGYVYLKSNQRERRPSQGTFSPGEFSALFQQAVNTVDLIFKDGIDWQAFFQSFQDLRTQYADQDLAIQAIERKRDGAFVVRLEVAEGSDKAAIETDAKQLYESRLKSLESRYEKQLRLQGEQHSEEIQRLIEAERQEKSTLMGVITTMANNQGPKYDLRNAQFAGGFAETVQGKQVGGTINNNATERPSLTEAAAEIQNLLKQLEASNPKATEAEQAAYLSAMIPPTQRERFAGALRAAGGAAIEEVPYGAVLKALVEGWQKSNG